MPDEVTGSVEGQIAAKRKLPGEEMACLEIALGILGVLLLILPVLTSIRHPAVLAAELALLAGVVLAIAGGFLGLRERRQRRASSLMAASGVLLTITSVVLLIGARDGLISWDFPVGIIFFALALFSDLAAYRFRRVLAA